MLPPMISEYIPYLGIFFIVLAVIFEILSVIADGKITADELAKVDIPGTDMKNNITKLIALLINPKKFHNLAIVFAICGVAFMACVHS